MAKKDVINEDDQDFKWDELLVQVSFYSTQEENRYCLLKINISVTLFMRRKWFWRSAAMLTVRNAHWASGIISFRWRWEFPLVLRSVFSTCFASWFTPDWCESNINQGSHLDPPDPNNSKDSRPSVSLGITSEVRTPVEVNYLYSSPRMEEGKMSSGT